MWNAVPVINRYKSFVFGMQALPYVGGWAKRADSATQLPTLAPNTTSLVAPQYAEKSNKVDVSLKLASLCLNAAPYVANNVCNVAQKMDSVLDK